MAGIMLKSERFKKFIEIFEDCDIDELAKIDMREIKERTGLNEEEIRNLIIKNDISAINGENYASIFDVLHEYAFHNFKVLFALLNGNRNLTFDIDKLNLNLTLKAMFEESCICNRSKCTDISDAICNFHSYCMKFFISKGIFYKKTYNGMLTYDIGIAHYIEKLAKNPNENFYSSLKWLLENGYLDKAIKINQITVSNYKNILLESAFTAEKGIFEYTNNKRLTMLLLENGAKPVTLGFRNYSEIVFSCCDLETIKMFVDNELPVTDDVILSTLHGRDTFDKKRASEVIGYFFDYVVDRENLLKRALSYGYVEIVRLLIEHGVEPCEMRLPDNFKKFTDRDLIELFNMGFTLSKSGIKYDLNWAIIYEREDLCIVLLDHGIKADMSDCENALERGLNNVCMKIFSMTSDPEIKINLAVRLGKNEYAIEYFETVEENLISYMDLISKHGNDELKKYFKQKIWNRGITIIAGMKKVGNQIITNKQTFTDFEMAKNFIINGSNYGRYYIDNKEFKNKASALVELEKY